MCIRDSWTISHFADKKVKAFIDAHPNQSKSRKERYKDWKYKQVVSLRKKIRTMRKGKIRLDPDALKGKGEPELPIEEVYPMVYFKHPRRGSEKGAYGFLLQILYDPTWRGFEIVGPYAPSPASVPKYGGAFIQSFLLMMIWRVSLMRMLNPLNGLCLIPSVGLYLILMGQRGRV